MVEHVEDARVEPKRVGESMMKKRKQLPINMEESDYKQWGDGEEVSEERRN